MENRRLDGVLEGSTRKQMRCPNANDEQCTAPACTCYNSKPLQPSEHQQATKVLGDYIQRVVDAEKGLPDPITVDGSVLRFLIRALHRKEPYLMDILQKELDKAKRM